MGIARVWATLEVFGETSFDVNYPRELLSHSFVGQEIRNSECDPISDIIQILRKLVADGVCYTVCTLN